MKIGVKLNSLLLNCVNTVGGSFIKKINAFDRHIAFTLHQLIYFASASFKMCFNLVPDNFSYRGLLIKMTERERRAEKLRTMFQSM